jgi:hypothetical protein
MWARVWQKEEERSLISMRGWEFEHRCPGGGFQKQEAGTGAAPALPLDAKAPCADADAVKSSLCMATSIVFIVVAIASVALRLVRIDKYQHHHATGAPEQTLGHA